MYFNIYFDPQVISVANAAGELGLQSLTAILRGFLQNCFVAEFEEYRIQPEIDAELKKLPSTSDRSTLMKIVKKMILDNRFIYCLKIDENAELISALLIPANREILDLALVGELSPALIELDDTEIQTLTTYQNSNFEEFRAKLANDGVTLKKSSMEGGVFLDRHFARALQHAQRIDIIDKFLLLKYKNNFKYSLGILFDWLRINLREPSACSLVFHSAFKDDDDGQSNLAELKSDLQAFKVGALKELEIHIEPYDADYYNECLPHDRFLLTDQIAIGVPRGLDLFVMENYKAMIRDVTLDCKNKNEISGLLAAYSGFVFTAKRVQVV